MNLKKFYKKYNTNKFFFPGINHAFKIIPIFGSFFLTKAIICFFIIYWVLWSYKVFDNENKNSTNIVYDPYFDRGFEMMFKKIKNNDYNPNGYVFTPLIEDKYGKKIPTPQKPIIIIDKPDFNEIKKYKDFIKFFNNMWSRPMFSQIKYCQEKKIDTCRIFSLKALNFDGTVKSKNKWPWINK